MASDAPVLRLLAILALLSLAFAASAHAADPVTNTNDSGPGSLRNALATAGLNDTIAIPPGTYSLTIGQLVAEDNGLTLTNQPGADKPTIVSTGKFRVLCVDAPNAVTVRGLVIHGGTAAPGGGGHCDDSQGGGIHAEAGSSLTVDDSIVQHNTAAPAQGGGGGIFAAGNLAVSDSIVRHNTTTAGLVVGDNNGGGGIRWAGSGNFSITDSTVYENTATVGGAGSGGGGVYSNGAPNTLTNVTFSGNVHVAGAGTAAGGGGGAILVKTAAGTIRHATFFGNHSDRDGGALSGSSTSLQNSVFAGNTAQSNPDCGIGAANSLGGNVSSAAGQCGFGVNDKPGVDPRLGSLAVNGSDNGTLTHALLERTSPAVEFPTSCPVAADQRGVSRSQFGNCDSGAFEFDGNTTAAVPDCSPSGVIPLALDAAPGGQVVGLRYMVNGGPELADDTGDSGQPLTNTSVTFPEGRATIEYWGQWTNGVQQGHGLQNVLVDKTKPTVDVERPDGESIFVITRRETVNVNAADALSGLVQDPSGTGVPVNTGSRGAATFAPTAADLCANQASDAFDYRVLAPGLGVRTVLERVRGTVRVTNGTAGAHASQKGIPFSPLRVPRELPVRSFIDARKGTARLTSARTRREDQIQDGLFSGAVFQVLQSRRVRAKGLTNVRLKGGNFRRCPPPARAGSAGAALSRLAIRRLRGSASGRFRTTGRNSSATVRGTVWEVIDRCDGTLTKVKRGRVVVRDFRLKKNVVVRAGKSYLARAPG